MIFIVYYSAQPPVQILLFDLQIPFSSDWQSATNRAKLPGSELAVDTATD